MGIDRHTELKGLLSELKLSEMAANFSQVALASAKEGLSHEAFLYELVKQEQAARQERRLARLLTQSKLPTGKTFTGLELGRYSPLLRSQLEKLRSGSFVAEAINVVAVGPPGVGKSHAVAAIGYDLIRQGKRVGWSSTAGLVQGLLLAKRELRLVAELERLNRIDCLIMDDIGYVQHNRDEMEVLFTLLSERYERRSVIITTNLVFSEWERIFKDPLTTLAALDRVIHHSVVLDMRQVESYRARQALDQRQTSGSGGEGGVKPLVHATRRAVQPPPHPTSDKAANTATSIPLEV
jgi:DNA replication protein DnaC